MDAPAAGCLGGTCAGGPIACAVALALLDVELSPPYDVSGNTALLGARLLFEMLWVLPRVRKSY